MVREERGWWRGMMRESRGESEGGYEQSKVEEMREVNRGREVVTLGEKK